MSAENIEDTILNRAKPIDGAEPDRKGTKTNSAGASLVIDILSVLMRSPAHKYLFLSDLEWFITPPLRLKQFRVFQQDGKPIGLALWAHVSEDVEKDLVAGRTRLKPGEWNSGDRTWLLELIVPGKPTENAIPMMVDELSKKAFAGKSFKFRTVDAKTGEARIVEKSVSVTH